MCRARIAESEGWGWGMVARLTIYVRHDALMHHAHLSS